MDLEFLKPKIAEVAVKHSLDFVVLFGSQATGRTHPKSDVDIGVISKSKFDILRVMTDLDDVFKRDDVNAVDLSRASPTLMRAIVEDGKLLYERSEDQFLNWKFYAIKIWMETKWLRTLGDRKLVEWVAQNA